MTTPVDSKPTSPLQPPSSSGSLVINGKTYRVTVKNAKLDLTQDNLKKISELAQATIQNLHTSQSDTTSLPIRKMTIKAKAAQVEAGITTYNVNTPQQLFNAVFDRPPLVVAPRSPTRKPPADGDGPPTQMLTLEPPQNDSSAESSQSQQLQLTAVDSLRSFALRLNRDSHLGVRASSGSKRKYTVTNPWEPITVTISAHQRKLIPRSIVYHLGRSLTSGHDVTYTRDQSDILFLHKDTIVERRTQRDLERGHAPYMIFYEVADLPPKTAPSPDDSAIAVSDVLPSTSRVAPPPSSFEGLPTASPASTTTASDGLRRSSQHTFYPAPKMLWCMQPIFKPVIQYRRTLRTLPQLIHTRSSQHPPSSSLLPTGEAQVIPINDQSSLSGAAARVFQVAFVAIPENPGKAARGLVIQGTLRLDATGNIICHFNTLSSSSSQLSQYQTPSISVATNPDQLQLIEDPRPTSIRALFRSQFFPQPMIDDAHLPPQQQPPSPETSQIVSEPLMTIPKINPSQTYQLQFGSDRTISVIKVESDSSCSISSQKIAQPQLAIKPLTKPNDIQSHPTEYTLRQDAARLVFPSQQMVNCLRSSSLAPLLQRTPTSTQAQAAGLIPDLSKARQ